MRNEQIKYFLDAAESGSMLKAAEQNFVTQPAVSTAISKLEEELGVVLINRSKQGIVLTESGEIAKKHFLLLKQQMRIMMDELAPYQMGQVDETEGIIELCATLDISYKMLHQVMGDFYKKYPNCSFSIREYDFLDIITAVGGGRAAFGVFCIVDEMLKEPMIIKGLEQFNLAVEKIGSDQLMVAVNKDSPLAKKRSIPLKEVLEKPLVIYNSSLENCWHELFLHKYHAGARLVRTNSWSYLMDLLLNKDHLVFILNAKTTKALGQDLMDFVMIPVKEKFQVTIGILSKSDRPLDNLSKAFIAYLRQAMFL